MEIMTVMTVIYSRGSRLSKNVNIREKIQFTWMNMTTNIAGYGSAGWVAKDTKNGNFGN